MIIEEDHNIKCSILFFFIEIIIFFIIVCIK